MAYSFTEKKRIRKNFGKRPTILDVPYLLSIQLNSYNKFLQVDKEVEGSYRHRTACCVSDGISDRQLFRQRRAGVRELPPWASRYLTSRNVRCVDLTYAAPIRVKVRLVIYDKEASGTPKPVKDIREQEVYLGEMPLMTRSRHFRDQWNRARHRVAVAPFAGRVL